MEAQALVINLLRTYTQEEIEEETKIPQATISKLKRGKAKDIRLSYFRALEALRDKIEAREKRKARAQQDGQQSQQTAAAA